MTADMMNLRALLEKNSDTDMLREMIGFAAQRLMEPEVEGLTGAGHGERRLCQSNELVSLLRTQLQKATRPASSTQPMQLNGSA